MAKVKINDTDYEIMAVKHNSEEGWGHHGFEAVVKKDDKYYWAYSSGCSCSGTAHTQEIDKETIKVIDIDESTAYEIGGESQYEGEDLEFNDY
jgi:hypothetical protein